MDYLKDYSEALYAHVQALRQRELPAQVRRINFLRKEFFHLKRKWLFARHRPEAEILEKASAFLNRSIPEIEAIAKTCLQHRDEGLERSRTGDNLLPYWTHELDYRWLCLNLRVQTDWYYYILKACLDTPEIYNVKTVYDYGCGCGAFTLMLNNLLRFKHVVLSDLENYVAEFVRYYIQQTPSKSIQWENILDANDAENTYDMILCLDVLEHLEDSYRHFLKMHKALKPGGLFVLKIAFESNDSTHLPQASEDFFVRNNGMEFLKQHYIVCKKFDDEALVGGVYKKI